jgi:hypothetical protein
VPRYLTQAGCENLIRLVLPPRMPKPPVSTRPDAATTPVAAKTPRKRKPRVAKAQPE